MHAIFFEGEFAGWQRRGVFCVAFFEERIPSRSLSLRRAAGGFGTQVIRGTRLPHRRIYVCKYAECMYGTGGRQDVVRSHKVKESERLVVASSKLNGKVCRS